MRLGILGAGAMGSVFGGYLAQAGHDVTLVDVNREHIDAVRAGGLELRWPDGRHQRIRLGATADPGDGLSEPFDAVLVLCKSWANREAAASIRHAVGDGTWVATVQNGLGNEQVLGEVLGPARVLPGTTTVGAMWVQPGVVEVSPITADGRSITQLGPPRVGDRDHVAGAAPLVAALNGAGLRTELLPDADVVIWTKLAMAATCGSLTAALRCTVDRMLASPTAMAMERALFDELLAVAAAEGVELDADAVWAHCIAAYEAVGPHWTSMAADVMAERRTEIDAFCVEVARRGAVQGVPTPHHLVIGALLVALEEQRGLR